jgi:enoyl-CoA hydratase
MSVRSERRGAVAWIRIERPEKLNALSRALRAELAAALAAAEADDEVRVVVLAGGERAFSVGYDLAEEAAREADVGQVHETLAEKVALTMQVWGLEKPVIGAVSGWCLAGGCELAMACDVVIAAEGAQFGEPEIRFGSGPVTLLMPFVVGQKKAAELLLTGDTIDAAQAERLGIVNRVVPAAELEAEVSALAERIALTPLPTLRLTKRALKRASAAMGLQTAVDGHVDVAAVLNATPTPERAEFNALVVRDGLRAALAWRDARYGGLTRE